MRAEGMHAAWASHLLEGLREHRYLVHNPTAQQMLEPDSEQRRNIRNQLTNVPLKQSAYGFRLPELSLPLGRAAYLNFHRLIPTNLEKVRKGSHWEFNLVHELQQNLVQNPLLGPDSYILLSSFTQPGMQSSAEGSVRGVWRNPLLTLADQSKPAHSVTAPLLYRIEDQHKRFEPDSLLRPLLTRLNHLRTETRYTLTEHL